jgi:predicted NAD/FAD-dependent oxidoreductase
MRGDRQPAALRVVVAGAGVAGLGAGRRLQDEGHSVVLLDKGRGPGGRISTRRRGDVSFDHGAQYFTARNEGFRRQVSAWVDRGVVARWTGRVGALDQGRSRPGSTRITRHVGVPGMSALADRVLEAGAGAG